MKKIIAIVLTLCLLCGAVALAENTTITEQSTQGSTTVSYTIATNSSYTITIPSSIALTNEAPSKELTVALNASSFNYSGKAIVVSLSKPSFKLGNQIPYTIADGVTAITDAYDVIKWAYNETNKTATKVLTITLGDVPTGLAAGEYSDTLTFTASVSGGVTVDGWENGGDLGGGEAVEVE